MTAGDSYDETKRSGPELAALRQAQLNQTRNNSSAHVNQEFRTPLILRALMCGILGSAVQLRRSGKPLPPPVHAGAGLD